MKTIFTTAMMLLVTLLILPCGAEVSHNTAHDTAHGAVVVKIKDFTFEPAVVTIAVGQTIEWVNVDDEPHTVELDNKSLRSPPMDTNERFSYSFSNKGTIAYHCSLHPHMTGSILVVDSTPPY